MPPITITLWQIEAHTPCRDGWYTVLAAKHLHGGDYNKPFPLSATLDTNGLYDTVWAMRCLPEHDSLWRKYAVWCARQVQHLMRDQRSIDALDVAWLYAHGEATAKQLAAAKTEAWAAAAAATAFTAEAAAAWVAVELASRAAIRVVAQLKSMPGMRGAQRKKLREILDAGEWAGDQRG